MCPTASPPRTGNGVIRNLSSPLHPETSHISFVEPSGHEDSDHVSQDFYVASAGERTIINR
jgi:hypothetical protein